jgi:hypothetical protein
MSIQRGITCDMIMNSNIHLRSPLRLTIVFVYLIWCLVQGHSGVFKVKASVDGGVVDLKNLIYQERKNTMLMPKIDSLEGKHINILEVSAAAHGFRTI